MESKDVDVLIEVIHPFVKELSQVLKNNIERLEKLPENDKWNCFDIIEEITDVLLKAHKENILKNAQHLPISCIQELIRIYLHVSCSSNVKQDKQVV